MEILGIGPSELIFIIIIALIVLGPKDMQKTGRAIGRWLRKIVTSDGWKVFQQTSREIQTLPNRLMREAQLDELQKLNKDVKQDLKQTTDSIRKDTRLPSSIPTEPSGSAPTEAAKPSTPSGPENTILPSPPPPAPPEPSSPSSPPAPPSSDEKKSSSDDEEKHA